MDVNLLAQSFGTAGWAATGFAVLIAVVAKLYRDIRTLELEVRKTLEKTMTRDAQIAEMLFQSAAALNQSSAMLDRVASVLQQNSETLIQMKTLMQESRR